MLVSTAIIVAGAKFGAGAIAKKLLQDWLESGPKALREAWAEQLEDFNFETRRITDRIETNLGEIASAIDEQQAKRAFGAATMEALRATDQERIRLLAAAFVGFVTVDVESELRSRAYRTALQFEPSDVQFLRDLLEWEAKARHAWHEHAESQRAGHRPPSPDVSHVPLVEKYSMQLSAAEAAGCIGKVRNFETDVGFGDPVPVVNPIGKAVLQLLSHYQHIETADNNSVTGASTSSG